MVIGVGDGRGFRDGLAMGGIENWQSSLASRILSTTHNTTTVTRQKKKQANDRSQRGLPKGVVAKSEGE